MGHCTNCGAELAPGGRFCGSCGVPVAPTAPPAPASADGTASGDRPGADHPDEGESTEPAPAPPGLTSNPRFLAIVTIVGLICAGFFAYFIFTYDPTDTDGRAGASGGDSVGEAAAEKRPVDPSDPYYDEELRTLLEGGAPNARVLPPEERVDPEFTVAEQAYLDADPFDRTMALHSQALDVVDERGLDSARESGDDLNADDLVVMTKARDAFESEYQELRARGAPSERFEHMHSLQLEFFGLWYRWFDHVVSNPRGWFSDGRLAEMDRGLELTGRIATESHRLRGIVEVSE